MAEIKQPVHFSLNSCFPARTETCSQLEAARAFQETKQQRSWFYSAAHLATLHNTAAFREALHSTPWLNHNTLAAAVLH